MWLMTIRVKYMQKIQSMFVAGACLILSGGVLADEPMTVDVKRLSLSTAEIMARAALDACEQQGIQIGVTVLDRNGIPQVVLRNTVAPPVTLEISRGKAYAAVMFNTPTSQLGDRAATPIGRVAGVVMSSGGLPVQVGGNLLGSIGVSGAPSGETDEACAQAGLDAVLDDLEMAD